MQHLPHGRHTCSAVWSFFYVALEKHKSVFTWFSWTTEQRAPFEMLILSMRLQLNTTWWKTGPPCTVCVPVSRTCCQGYSLEQNVVEPESRLYWGFWTFQPSLKGWHCVGSHSTGALTPTARHHQYKLFMQNRCIIASQILITCDTAALEWNQLWIWCH